MRSPVLTMVLLAAVIAVAPSRASAIAGARLLRDIVPGPATSNPELLGIVNGALLFFATDEAHGRELWRSDGTVEGTQLVRDIRPGPLGGIGYGGWALFAGRLAFSASDGTGGAQLWSSDGTEAGTVLVRDVAPGIDNAMVRLLTPNGPRLWFTAQSNFYDQNLPEYEYAPEDLWVTDLTTDGTQRRAAGVGYWQSGFSGGAAVVDSLTPFADGVLISRKDGFECCERVMLNRIDAAGEITTLYHEDMGGHLGYLPAVEPFVAMHTAYFLARLPYSCALWRSDGIETAPLGDTSASCPFTPLTTFGNDLLLASYGPQVELVRATPTDASLTPVAHLGEGNIGYAPVSTPAGLYFSIGRSDADELWRTDNATDPPSLLRRFPRAAPTSPYFGQLMRAGDGVAFWISDNEGLHGVLWESSGTAATTQPIGVLPATVSGGAAVESGSLVFVAGYDAEHGGELWLIDRTPGCDGDCDGDATVGVAEVIAAVGVALGDVGLDVCPAADANADLTVSVNELVISVRRALDGCPAGARRS